MSPGDEADVLVGELEAAVESGHHEMDLLRGDLVAVGPADDAAVVHAGVQGEVDEALIEAHQGDPGALREPRRRMPVNLRDARPGRGRRRGRRYHETRRRRGGVAG